MKSFKNFIISEDVDLTANVEKGLVDVHDHAVRNNINGFLNGALGCGVVTPYVALNKVSKVLANFHIFLPKAPYMEDEQGVQVFNINQFGRVAGMKDDGSVVTKVEQPYHLYFEWKRNERGMYDVFSEIVDDEELADLLDQVEDDISGAGPNDDRSEKIYEEKDDEEKHIKKAYKSASKDPENPKIAAHLRFAAKAVKKKLDKGKKIDEEKKKIK